MFKNKLIFISILFILSMGFASATENMADDVEMIIIKFLKQVQLK